MPKPPSTETELRRARSALKAALSNARAHKARADTYYLRLCDAEREVAEWKRRFDALLARSAPSAGS